MAAKRSSASGSMKIISFFSPEVFGDEGSNFVTIQNLFLTIAIISFGFLVIKHRKCVYMSAQNFRRTQSAHYMGPYF